MSRNIATMTALMLVVGLGLGGGVPIASARSPGDQLNIVKHPSKDERFFLGTTPFTTTLVLNEEEKARILKIACGQDANTTLRLRIGDLKPTDKNQFKGGRVFLNLPEDIEKSHPESLVPSSPNYVGSFSFYPSEGEENSFYLTLNTTISRLAKRSKLPDSSSIRITIVGIPNTPNSSSVGSDAGDVEFSELAVTTVASQKAN